MALLSNDIYIGSIGARAKFHFTNDQILLNSMVGIFNVDLISNELPIDTFSFSVRYNPSENRSQYYGTSDGEIYGLDSESVWYATRRPVARDLMNGVPFGTPVWWYCDGTLKGKGYASKIERTGKYAYKITCVSGVGLLDDKIHPGGLYSGETFSSIMADIVNSSFAYAIQNAVAGVRMYGHLPYDTARNNLHRLLFAVGAVMTQRNEYEDYLVRFLSDSPVITVPERRIALGGRVEYQLPSNRVEVIEHGFFKTTGDETVVLYDNMSSQAATELTVIFQNSPVYDLTATGNLIIVDQSVNHAVVSGVGTLTGKLYTHTRQIMVLTDNSANDPERTRRVTDNELVSAINSRSVAQRVLSYYKTTRLIQSKLLLTSEKPGSFVRMEDAYGDPISGFISRMELMPTSLMAAVCKIANGYVTNAYGNTYKHRVVYTRAEYPRGPIFVGPTIIASETKSIRVVLIGGGTGGQAGYDGEDGDSLTVDDRYTVDGNWSAKGWREYAQYTGYFSNQGHEQKIPLGGQGGAPGSPGKVYIFDIDVSFLDERMAYLTYLSFNIGSGGTGGDANGNLGSAGGATELSFWCSSFDPESPYFDETHSSDEGVVPEFGIQDIMTPEVYSLPGENGTRGGNGGQTDENSLDATSGYTWWPHIRRTANNGAFASAVHPAGYNGYAGESVGAYAGGAGGAGYGYDGNSDASGLKGYNHITQNGSTTPTHVDRDGVTRHYCDIYDSYYQFPQAVAGGGGGGAAVGASGSSGSSYRRERYGQILYTGNGGDGANASPPADVGFGCGGNGGHGGGAGGNGGGGFNYGVEYDDKHNEDVEQPDDEFELFTFINTGASPGGLGGSGGAGSRGGNGGDGAVIIYY